MSRQAVLQRSNSVSLGKDQSSAVVLSANFCKLDQMMRSVCGLLRKGRKQESISGVDTTNDTSKVCTSARYGVTRGRLVAVWQKS